MESPLCSEGGGGWGQYLGPVQLQLVVSDPPRLLSLQPLGSLLLHVVLLQPVGLDQLLEAQLTAQGQVRDRVTLCMDLSDTLLNTRAAEGLSETDLMHRHSSIQQTFSVTEETFS